MFFPVILYSCLGRMGGREIDQSRNKLVLWRERAMTVVLYTFVMTGPSSDGVNDHNVARTILTHPPAADLCLLITSCVQCDADDDYTHIISPAGEIKHAVVEPRLRAALRQQAVISVEGRLCDALLVFAPADVCPTQLDGHCSDPLLLVPLAV